MANNDYDIIWKETMNQIREELGEQEFAMWFNLEYLKASENELTIGVPSTFYQDQVRQRYQLYIEGKIRDLIGKNLTLDFVVNARPWDESAGLPADHSGIPQKPSDPAALKPASGLPSGKPKKQLADLRDDYTFETYVVGDDNNFAFNAASAVARNPGASTNYNPLLIYGGVGLGKTHLMQAIGHYIYNNFEGKVLYITAEGFMNEFLNLLKENKMAAFKNKYRYVDALLIDDIHNIERGERTQEELFYTFDALYNAKKQMVFTCDRPISELKNLTTRLKSRFEWGLNVDLKPPNYETRFAILKKKMEAKKVTIPDDVIDLISKNVSTNVRDLEGALNKLTAYAEYVKPITMEIAQELLRDVFAAPKQSNLSIDIIQREVAEHYQLSPSDLRGKKRNKSIVLPRQIAMYVSRKLTELSTIEVGQSFGGRDHTTVLHSCDKIESLMRLDHKFDLEVQNLMRDIKTHGIKS
ncbi:MAG: chromosomal replication initiator protein DnaA [Treponema sp.]|jgi:chromosomal replication initiator protein|nr:chromosomal replication initiator protein DnaA [Treponema sp.]